MIYRVLNFKQCNCPKQFFKLFQKLPPGETPSLDVFEGCMNFNIYWYDYVLDCCSNNPEGSVRNRFPICKISGRKDVPVPSILSNNLTLKIVLSLVPYIP